MVIVEKQEKDYFQDRMTALSIALPLSGLEAEHFYALGAGRLYDHGVKTLSGTAPSSPSTKSDSSGISSLPNSGGTATPTTSPTQSRPNTPASETSKANKGQVEAPLRVQHQGRDILNLGANVREPSWQVRYPTMPRQNLQAFMENRSIYYRLGEHGLTEEYPAVSEKIGSARSANLASPRPTYSEGLAGNGTALSESTCDRPKTAADSEDEETT
ncbi:uncharacterized protein LOC105696308 isoform X1 [Orussus abietinus]|uniref:uncharacterized protein LOC105696308 isoform X1 n=1 Tax=Orussus abietinus TaxID=222816 RepID=UPI0006260F5A|nr:uncharacterized protein LOC105696308 isoform X1 [Orussus abietinus]